MPYSNYRPELMGSATLEPSGPVEAGSYQSLTLVYTAGCFGVDDTGSIKIGFRFATDFGPVQFDLAHTVRGSSHVNERRRRRALPWPHLRLDLQAFPLQRDPNPFSRSPMADLVDLPFGALGCPKGPWS